jgi:hypothetical protein
VAVCAGGIAGMIVSSVLNHNGAAITFGLITAAAVLCSMVATAVAADVTRQLLVPAVPGAVGGGAPLASAPLASAVPHDAASPVGPATGAGMGDAEMTPSRAAPRARPAESDEEQAALVESLVDDLVQAGADEVVLRELVRQSVRLGRILAAR